MSVPAARTDPRLKRYPLRRLRLPMANGTLDVVVPDAGAWLHTGGWSQRAARGEEPPYWADVWPAAVALARLLCRRGPLAGVRCLDLGCGIGVPGIAAAKLGASVTFADREADALAFAEWNARRVAVPEALVATVVHDWHAGPVAGPCDLLLLADVTYRPVHHRPVLRQIEACLASGGVALHADPYRREVEGFLVQARAAFAHRQIEASTHWDGKRLPVRIQGFAGAEAALDRWLPTTKLDSSDLPGDSSRPSEATEGPRR